jgi:hypothetical protein
MRVAPNADTARLPWSFPPWLLPFWVAGVGWQWWKLGVRQIEIAHGTAIPHGAWVGLISMLGRFGGFLIESGAYVLLWALFRRRLRFWRFASWLVTISVLEVLAESMRLDLMTRGGAQLRDAILLGPIVLHGVHERATAALAAFGSLGITTALRIGWSAGLQARELGVRWPVPLVATALVWALTRAAVWMVTELIAGRSVSI